MDFLLTAPLGLEALAKNELKKQKIRVQDVTDKGVYFTGDVADMMRANLWSRYGNKVYYIVGDRKKTEDFDTLFEEIYSVDWLKYIPKDFKINIYATSIKSTLHSLPALQSVTKRAIIKKLITQKSPSVDEIGRLEEDSRL